MHVCNPKNNNTAFTHTSAYRSPIDDWIKERKHCVWILFAQLSYEMVILHLLIGIVCIYCVLRSALPEIKKKNFVSGKESLKHLKKKLLQEKYQNFFKGNIIARRCAVVMFLCFYCPELKKRKNILFKNVNISCYYYWIYLIKF